ncbi:MAG: cobalt ECF transporter T component CbiQ [Candidatus Methylomirabilia bacterium]
MFELFSDIFTYRENRLTGADPRAKLVVALAAILLVLVSTRPALPLLVAGAALATLAALRFPLGVVAARLSLPLGMVFVVFALRLFTIPGETLFTLDFAGIALRATREGLWVGVLAALRVFAATSVLVLLGMVAPAHALFRALLWFRIPRGLVEVGLLMYRFIFVLLDIAADMATAQRLRLGYRGAARSLRSVGSLAGAVLVKSLDQAARTGEAMVLRGYAGTMPVGALPRLPRRELRWMFALTAALGIAYLAGETAGVLR